MLRVGWLLLLLLPLQLHAEIFKWVDAQGNVHFGDAPPESAQVETVTPNTEKMGVQLTRPDAAADWKQQTLEKKPDSAATTPVVPSATGSASSHDYQQEDFCAGTVGDCFSEEQDYVCKLRYGEECQAVYHWKVCLHQQCEDNRLVDKCDSPFYFLDKRPVMLGRRDVGRSLPIKGWVSSRDWECLSAFGLYCDEVAFEHQCQEQYRQSCDELKNWVNAAKARCAKSRDGDCSDIDILIRYRPAPVEEVRKAGTMNANGRVISQDLLMQSLGVFKPDATDDLKLKSTLEQITGLNISDTRRSFDCERRWP